MADVKIADLLTATTVNNNDLFVVEDNADTKKITYSNLKSNMYNNPTFTGVVTASQIKFPAVQVPSADPNTLDDYEEGTFTPTVATSGLAITVIRNAKYIKIGKLVNGVFYVDINNTSGVAKTIIEFGGLPFVADGWNFAHKLFGTNSALAQCYVESTSNKIYTSSDNILPGVTSNMYYFSYIATV